MKLFKNKVGRPSNETKNMRRVFVISIVAIIISLVTLAVSLLCKSNVLTENLKGATGKYKIYYSVRSNKKGIAGLKLNYEKTLEDYHNGSFTIPKVTSNDINVSSGYSCTFKGWIVQRRKDGYYRVWDTKNKNYTWQRYQSTQYPYANFIYGSKNKLGETVKTFGVSDNVTLYADFDCSKGNSSSKNSGGKYKVTFALHSSCEQNMSLRNESTTYTGGYKIPAVNATYRHSNTKFKYWIIQRVSDGRYRVYNKDTKKYVWYNGSKDKKINWSYATFTPGETTSAYKAPIKLYAVCGTGGSSSNNSYTNSAIRPSINLGGSISVGSSTSKFKVTTTESSVSVVSSDTGVLQVIKYGNNTPKGNSWALKAKKTGTAIITIKADKEKETYKYTVYDTLEPSIGLGGTLVVGNTTGKFNVKTTGSSVSVVSSDTGVLQVIKYGNNSPSGNKWALKALKAGTATVTIKAGNQTKTYKYTVNVLINPSIILGGTLTAGKSTSQFYVKTTGTSVSVASSNTGVLQVIKYGNNSPSGNKWALKAIRGGKANVTITVDGAKKIYNYTVNDTLEPSIGLGGKLWLGNSTSKFNVKTTGSSVSVTSSNPSVLQVIKYGNNSPSGNKWAIKAKKVGTATITIKAGNTKKTYVYNVSLF